MVAALAGEIALVLEFDGGECAEEEIAGVDQDGGAARGDAALLEDERKVPEQGVDVRRRFVC